MLEHFRSWAKARVVSMRRGTPQQIQHSARLKREARAHTVTDLQARVRLLQQQITDITAAVERGGESSSFDAERKTLVELEEQLATSQAELARYQGRI
jgi:hypothetical protein